jgi:hypothetical protein
MHVNHKHDMSYQYVDKYELIVKDILLHKHHLTPGYNTVYCRFTTFLFHISSIHVTFSAYTTFRALHLNIKNSIQVLHVS